MVCGVEAGIKGGAEIRFDPLIPALAGVSG
jgi:hypothetical protein